MKLQTGNTITWYSAAGLLTGVIKDIVLSENARGETVPWIYVTVINEFERPYNVCLCATHSNLIMMQVSEVEFA